MRYGLIGEHLPHSFSKEIHERLADYEYVLCEINRDDLNDFMCDRDFAAVNVTIPYKQAVIPHLSYIDPGAETIGAVNTIVNRNGELYGYNTDFYGMRELILHMGLDFTGASVLILGTGGTSKTAYAVAESLGAARIVKAGRRKSGTAVTYDEVYAGKCDFDYIVNTTPCGMFPNENGSDTVPATPVELSYFKKLRGVVDAVYNPLRTNLVLDALKRGIPASGGLYMLVAQAVKASEIFTDTTLENGVTNKVFEEIQSSKENIVLTGMPGSGKSTVGRALAKKTGRNFIDTDAVIVDRFGREISEIFAEIGEAGFRDIESAVIRDVSGKNTGVIIATGGGAVLRDENIRALKRSGRIFFLDRPLENIIPTDDRPLSSDRETLIRRYNERYGIYTSTCDHHIKTDENVSHTVDSVLELFYKQNGEN